MAKRVSDEARILAYFRTESSDKVGVMFNLVKLELVERGIEVGRKKSKAAAKPRAARKPKQQTQQTELATA